MGSGTVDLETMGCRKSQKMVGRRSGWTGRRVAIIGCSALCEEWGRLLKEAGLSVANLPDEPEVLVNLNVLKPEVVIVGEASRESFELCSQLYAPFRIPVILLGQNCREKLCRGVFKEVDNSMKQRALPGETEVLGVLLSPHWLKYFVYPSRVGSLSRKRAGGIPLE